MLSHFGPFEYDRGEGKAEAEALLLVIQFSIRPQAGHGFSMRVLVVEDGMMMRRMLVRTLEDWGFDVAEAENGKIAWQLFQENPFQLVLTDWVMPEMSGTELIRRIRSSDYRRYVYILLLTAMSEKSDLVTGMEAGADDFLVKPVNHEELRVRLREGERIILLERKLAEQNRQLKEAQAALVQNERLASLGQMAAGMAHELNNPIALVGNNLAVLKRDLASAFEILNCYRRQHEMLEQTRPEAAHRIAQQIEECDLDWIQSESPQLIERSSAGLKRIRDIVQNLREFARLDEARLDTIDVSGTLQSVADMMRRDFAAREVNLSVEPTPVPPIECEPAKIHQLLHNMLLNALQASRAGGSVRMRTTTDSEWVVIEVADEGSGIAAADLPHLFEPFFTTRPVGSGQGLGLAISHGIVRNHGGSIEVASELGRGSTFRVLLPQQSPRFEKPKLEKTGPEESTREKD